MSPSHGWADHEQPATAASIDPDLEVFLRNNKEVLDATEPARDKAALDVHRYVFVMFASHVRAFDLCAERWQEFADEPEEARRRIDLIQRAYVHLGILEAETMQSIGEQLEQAMSTTATTDYLLSDLDSLYATCQQGMYLMFSQLNFATE
jgi:hypothetical protein